MDAGSILIALGLVVAVTAFVARPLVERRVQSAAGRERQISALQAQHDAVLTMLRELEMDHAMGKMAEADYAVQRAALVARGASVLRQLDELGAGSVPPDEVDAAIEAAVAARRRAAVSEGEFCTQCGRALQPEDRFCANCGTPVRGEKDA